MHFILDVTEVADSIYGEVSAVAQVVHKDANFEDIKNFIFNVKKVRLAIPIINYKSFHSLIYNRLQQI